MRLFLGGANGALYNKDGEQSKNAIWYPKTNYFPIFKNRLLCYHFIKTNGQEKADEMRMFMGGVLPYDQEKKEQEINDRLISRVFIGSGQPQPETLRQIKKDRGYIMVDSGAFSVWTKGKVVDIDEYIEWAKENLPFVDYFVSLDVIPGTPTKPAISQVEREESAHKSLRNYHKMVRGGIPPEKLIHVLHFGEDVKWADRCRELPYIGFGGLVGQHPENRKKWLGVVIERVIDRDRMPVNKWHCFGVTDKETLLGVPLYSADSAGWLRHAVIGTCTIWDDEKEVLVAMLAKDLYTHPKTVRDKIETRAQDFGFTIDQLMEQTPEGTNNRVGFNLFNWQLYEDFINSKREYPFPMPQNNMQSLF